MRIHYYLAGLLFGSLLVIGCSEQSGKDDMNTDSDLMLLYMESEKGVEPYQSRVLINKDFIRMDDGTDKSDYTLYDRKKHIIYSVTHGEQTILELKPVKTGNRITRSLVLDAHRLDDRSIPKVDGMSPVHYQLTVNNKTCSTIFAVKGLHPVALTALREFRRILASIHLSKLNNTPEDMQQECFLAHEVKVPNRTLQFGLPVYEASANGFKRLLVDYKKQFTHVPGLFRLPKGYRITHMTGAAVN